MMEDIIKLLTIAQLNTAKTQYLISIQFNEAVSQHVTFIAQSA